MHDHDGTKSLLEREGGFCVSECHGFLCGLICSAGHAQERQVRDFFLLDTDDQRGAAGYYDYLITLAQEIAASLHTDEFNLQLLLADEDEPLAVRGKSLADWCQGFMNGIARIDVQWRRVSDESIELLEDFHRIARLDVDETEDAAPEPEAHEFALTELIEYVRIGAVFIFEELQRNGNGARPRSLH